MCMLDDESRLLVFLVSGSTAAAMDTFSWKLLRNLLVSKANEEIKFT